jgi:hypothetical protein
MPHQNIVFHDLLKPLPWHCVKQAVEKHGADDLSRKLDTKQHLLTLLYGQCSGAASLRDIVTSMSSHEARLYHLGAEPVRRSTLADANAQRPWQVFADIFAALLKQVHRGLRRKASGAVRLIDATGVRLSSLSADWATFSADVYGAKAHVVYDPQAACPIYFAVTPARVNDITAAKAMPLEAGATYVFDLGYYDYGFWASLDTAGCRFVTRLKKNTPLAVLQENGVPQDGGILSDRIGLLPQRLAASRRNPLQGPVREIRLLSDSGRELRIVTNDLKAPAAEIAELYRQRWQIELFFRWIKQTLRIEHFLGTSENAVRIQIAVALIAFLLLRLAHAAQQAVHRPIDFVRLVRANLMQRRRIDRLLETLPSIRPASNQFSLELNP